MCGGDLQLITYRSGAQAYMTLGNSMQRGAGGGGEGGGEGGAWRVCVCVCVCHPKLTWHGSCPTIGKGRGACKYKL